MPAKSRARQARGRFVKASTPTPLTPEQRRALTVIVIPVEARSVLDEAYVMGIAPQFWRGRPHVADQREGRAR